MPRVKATPRRITFGHYKYHSTFLQLDAYAQEGDTTNYRREIYILNPRREDHDRYLRFLRREGSPEFPITRLHVYLIQTVTGDPSRESLQQVLDRFKRAVVLRWRLPRLAHKARLARVHAELPAAAWAPSRVERWVAAGLELEDL